MRLLPADRASVSSPAHAAPRVPPRLWAVDAYVAAVVAVGAAAVVALAGGDGVGLSPAVPWWGLAVGFALTEAAVVHLAVGRHAHSFTLSEVVLVVGLMGASPVAVCVAVVLGPAITMLVQRIPLQKMAFNAGCHAWAAAATVVLVGAAVPDGASAPLVWAVVTVGCLAGSALSAALVAGAIHLSGGSRMIATLGTTVIPSFVVTATNAGLGLALATLLDVEPLAPLLLSPAAVLLFAGYRALVTQRAQAEALAFLDETVLDLSGDPDLDHGVRRLLLRTRRAFDADLAELILLPGRGGHDGVHLRLGPSDEAVAVEFDPSSVERLVGIIGAGDGRARVERRSGLLVGYLEDNGLERALLAELRVEDRVLGLLAVGHAGRVAGADRAELQLLHSLAGHAATVLQLDRLGAAYRELRDLRDRLEFQARHDSLTGAANRSSLLEALERARVAGGDHALAYVDLDGFKAVNDLFGHAAGDALLQRVTQRLRDALRPDDLVARVGGDEFVVLLAETPDPFALHQMAVRLEEQLGAPYRLPGVDGDARVGASVGTVVVDVAALGVDEALQAADAAMYARKADRVRRGSRRRS